MHPRRAARLLAAVAAAAAVPAALCAVPAWAHVEVTADNPQAGARNVTVTFTGEAESDSAGIVSERVLLPAGISPQDVRLAAAPAGWTLTTTADTYTVAGPALPVGADAVYSIVVAHLPADATELAFKTVETYSDGKVSRWIEIPEAGQQEPDNPAPVLKLQPAAAAAPTTATPTSAAATTPASTTPAAATRDDGSAGTGMWVALAAALAAAAVAAGLLVARRRRPTA